MISLSVEKPLVTIRDFVYSDLEAVKRLHEQSGIDYAFPDLNSPLFLVTKVAEHEGVVRACGGLYLQVETYLWMDWGPWIDPMEKLSVVSRMNEEAMMEAYLKGIDCACLWLPPNMERFGKLLELKFGFTRDREGWVSYSRQTHA